MEYSEAVKVLSAAVRHESRDHAFGDREIYWVKDGLEIAGGYFGGSHADVWIIPAICDGKDVKFKGDEAYELAKLGTTGDIGRNDETGPDTYNEGVTLPALTAEGVLDELTR